MPLAYYRLSPTMFVRLMITIWTAYIVAFVPNYQKTAYQNTPARNYGYYDGYDEDNAGYPAGHGYPVINSAKDAQLYDNYVIEIDVADLEGTNRYKDNVIGKKVYRGPFVRAINNNLSDYGIGQYYIATLESGEKIILFLDDTALDLPKSGKVILPVGKTCRVKRNSVFDYIQDKYQLSDENALWYADMSGRWREGEQVKELEKKKTYLYLGTMVVMVLVQILLHVAFLRKIKEMTEVVEK